MRHPSPDTRRLGSGLVLAALLVGAGCGEDISDRDRSSRDESGAIIEAGEVGVQVLRVGDCFVEPGPGETESVEALPCDQPHDNEVFAVVTAGQAADEYPGAEPLERTAVAACLTAFEPYVGLPALASAFDVFPLAPSEQSWAARGDRAVVCALTSIDGTSASASARGSQASRRDSSTFADTGQLSTFALAEGDCLLGDPDEQSGEVVVVACDQPHRYEVFAATALPGDVYPGGVELDAEARTSCPAGVAPYTGASAGAAGFEVGWFVPSRDSWSVLGDRLVVCLLARPGLVPSTGSARAPGS